jgi:hypothetical protein
MKSKKNSLTIVFKEETSCLLLGAFANLKEYSWQDLTFLKELVEGDLQIKIPLTINVSALRKPVYKNPFLMLILKNLGAYSRKKVPSFLCEDVAFEDVTVWAFNLERGREPLLYLEASPFQASAKTYFKQEKEIEYFEEGLSFPFVQKNKKYYQAINLATFLVLSEFYFEKNPLLTSLTTIAKPRYAKLLKKGEYLTKLLALCKYIKKETKAINKKIFSEEIAFAYNTKALPKEKKPSIFSLVINENLQFFRDFSILFYKKRGKIMAKVQFKDENEALFFKSKKIVETKLEEVLFQYVLYGKLVKEISNIFEMEAK